MRKRKTRTYRAEQPKTRKATVMNTRERILKLMCEVLQTSTERSSAALCAMKDVTDEMADVMTANNIERESQSEE